MKTASRWTERRGPNGPFFADPFICRIIEDQPKNNIDITKIITEFDRDKMEQKIASCFINK